MSRGESEPVDAMIDRVIAGRFQIVRVLGAGAWGKVYLAQHLALQKPIALKVLRARALADPTVANRFIAEARLASRLDHPNCVQILDFGRDEEMLFLAMEYIEGENLFIVLRREGHLPPVRAVRIMSQVAGALAAAHAQGIVHRDVKPANVMLTHKIGEDGPIADFVKVCDFGVAKALDPERHPLSQGPLTLQGTIVGTAVYMSPEQARGGSLDQRTDVFSCGVSLYVMLAGERPYPGETIAEVSRLHSERPPRPLAELVPAIDPELARIVARAMEVDRENRFASARELRTELVRYLGTANESEALTMPVASLLETDVRVPDTIKVERRNLPAHDGVAAPPRASRSFGRVALVVLLLGFTIWFALRALG